MPALAGWFRRARAHGGWAVALTCANISQGCSDQGDLSVGKLAQVKLGCPVVQHADYCTAIPSIAQPQIDGELDCGVELQPVPTDTLTRPVSLDGIKAEYAVGYTPSGLYYFVRVTKANLRPAEAQDALFCGDAVQLFADSDGEHPAAPDYDVPGTAQFAVPAPDGAAAPSRRGSVYVSAPAGPSMTPWTSPNFVSIATADGYAVEAFLSAGDLGLPQLFLQPAARVGFDVWICIGGERLATNDCGNRITDYGLRAADQGIFRGPHFNSAAFCNPTLGE